MHNHWLIRLRNSTTQYVNERKGENMPAPEKTERDPEERASLKAIEILNNFGKDEPCQYSIVQSTSTTHQYSKGNMDQPESNDPPNFPSYPKPQGVPLLSHPKQQSPLVKLTMQRLNRPKVRTNTTKAFPKARKKTKFW